MNLRFRFSLIVVFFSLFCAGCQNPTSGTIFKPEITGRTSGVFSYDIALKLDAIHQVDWSRGAEGYTENKTAIEGYLSEVSLTIKVFYTQGSHHETTAFKSRWDQKFDIVVNVPRQASIEGYDVNGTAYVFDSRNQFRSEIEIASSFRH